MSPLKRVVYIPEGRFADPNNYSGTPLYFGKALETVCKTHATTFEVLEVSEIINTEPLYALATAAQQDSAMLETYWSELPGEQTAPRVAKKLYSELLRSPEAATDTVKHYVSYWRDVTKRRLEPLRNESTSFLALNTLNPPLIESVYYFLDTPLAPFYFDSSLGLVPNRGHLPLLQALFEEQELQAIRLAKGLFFFSRYASELCEKTYHGAQSKSEIVGAGINFEHWPDVSESRVADREPIKVLFVGRDFQVKGGKLLLDAAKLLPPERFQFTVVTERRFHCDAPRWVHFLAPVEKSSLEMLYRSHDVFVFPTERDAFGLVVCEAMACGLPVIATNVRAMPDILGPASDFWNPYICSVSECVERLFQLAADSSFRWQIGQRNRLEASRRFRWKDTAEQILRRMVKDRERLQYGN